MLNAVWSTPEVIRLFFQLLFWLSLFLPIDIIADLQKSAHEP